MVDFKEVAKTGAEFIGCTITPIVSSGFAIREGVKHRDKWNQAEEKLYTLGHEILVKKEGVNYEQSLQTISQELKKEENEIWKKGCEVFWIPGMVVYTVVSFVSALFSKEKTPDMFVLEAIKETDKQIESLKNKLKQEGLEPKESAEISKEIKSLNERKEGLMKIKENCIDPKEKLLTAEKEVELKEKEIKKEEYKLNLSKKEIDSYQKRTDQGVHKLQQHFYSTTLKTWAFKHGLDEKTVKSFEKHLKPVFEQAIKEGRKELKWEEIKERGMLKLFPELRVSTQNMSLDFPSDQGDFEREIVESESLKGKDLTVLYLSYFKLIKTTDMSGVINHNTFNEYVLDNQKAYFMDDSSNMNWSLIGAIKENFVKINELTDIIASEQTLKIKKDALELKKSQIKELKELMDVSEREMANKSIKTDLDTLEKSMKESFFSLLYPEVDLSGSMELDLQMTYPDTYLKLNELFQKIQLAESGEDYIVKRIEETMNILDEFLLLEGIDAKIKDDLRTKKEKFQERLASWEQMQSRNEEIKSKADLL